MKKYRWIFALVLLVLAALACNAVTGGGSAPAAPTVEAPTQLPQSDQATEEPAPTAETMPETDSGSDSGGGEATVSTDFPLPDDASGMMDLGEAGINFQTKMSVDEAVAFYREAFSNQGLTERDLLTSITDGVFSMVFDGHASGKAVVIQGVDLGNGTTNINIRFEDV